MGHHTLAACASGLQVGGLAGNRAALIDALSPLGTSNIVGGEGAIYLFAKLPDGERQPACLASPAFTRCFSQDAVPCPCSAVAPTP